MQPTGMVDEATGHLVGRHHPEAHFVRHEDGRAIDLIQDVEEASDLGLDRPIMDHQIGQPKRQAINHEGAALGGGAAQGLGQGEGFFDGLPVGATALTMLGDAARHVVVQRFGGRDIEGLQAARLDQGFGVAAFARAGAAQDQGQAGKRAGFVREYRHVAVLVGLIGGASFESGQNRPDRDSVADM